MKSIQPISDPDEIRKVAAEETKEQYADYYVDKDMPDPLSWQSRTQKAEQTAELAEQNKTPEQTTAELSAQNDPLKNFE